MKKMFVIFVLACSISVAANANLNFSRNNKANAFVQPFNQSYALSTTYLWFTDIDLTNPIGSFSDIWYEMDRLRRMFPEYSFSHIPYGSLLEFEFGYAPPLYFATIYSNLYR